jgi:phage shock protein A
VAKLGEEIAQLQAKLDDARARQKAMQLRSDAASSRIQVQESLARGAGAAAREKFERMERRIDEMEARADVSTDRSLKAQFAELEADDEISRELEALRSRMSTTDKQGE